MNVRRDNALRRGNALSESASGGAIEADKPLRMGGIALGNGLILLSERHWAAAIRERDGEVSVASGKMPKIGSGTDDVGRWSPDSLPLWRGLARFGDSLLVLGLVKLRLPAAQLPVQGGRVVGALAGSLAASSVLKSIAPKSVLIQETGKAVAAFVPAMLALRNSSISAYHGAEHKVIGSRETSSRMEWTPAQSCERGRNGATVAEMGESNQGTAASARAGKEHDRCGSNLVGPLLLSTIVTNILLRSGGRQKRPAASALGGAIGLGASLEALRWAHKHHDSMLARILLVPGHAIQRYVTTTEPSPDQLEVGESALAELLRLEDVSV
jgi:uncharacterized protein YqhQ